MYQATFEAVAVAAQCNTAQILQLCHEMQQGFNPS
jgi:hypothetical protein